MAALKEAPLSGTAAWGPGSLLAAGTVAGAIDQSFSTTSQLEVRSAGDPQAAPGACGALRTHGQAVKGQFQLAYRVRAPTLCAQRISAAGSTADRAGESALCARAVCASASSPKRRPQVYAVDFATDERELRPAGTPLVAPERFSRLCWGSIGLDTEAFPVRPARPCRARAPARAPACRST